MYNKHLYIRASFGGETAFLPGEYRSASHGNFFKSAHMNA
jgi:hypothetical protein